LIVAFFLPLLFVKQKIWAFPKGRAFHYIPETSSGMPFQSLTQFVCKRNWYSANM